MSPAADGHLRRWAALAALMAGVVLVTLYDGALVPYRYAYSGDSASYVDMAT